MNHQITLKLLLSVPLLLCTFLFSACHTSSSSLQHPTTSATLWMQNSAEYKALTTSIYRTASAKLVLAKEDAYWTAYTPQEDNKIRKLSPAVILDVDETVLDNSPFQARMIKQNSRFDLEQWNKWVMEAKANAVAGAVEFTQQAYKKGITIFYLTNREAKVEEGTRENLKKLGFPLSDHNDHILSKNERENWTSAKTERRKYVAENHRILMLFGDNLNDFVSAENISQQQRHQLVKDNKSKWGQKWFILPNPAYGSWESALYNFDNRMNSSQIDSVKKAMLHTKTNEK